MLSHSLCGNRPCHPRHSPSSWAVPLAAGAAMPLARLAMIYTPARAIAVGLLLALSSWFMAALVDACYRDSQLREQLFHPGQGDAAQRLLFMAILLVFLL